MWKLENLITSSKEVMSSNDGKNYVPARPLPWSGIYGTFLRLKDAWAVFRGKADAFTWPQDQ